MVAWVALFTLLFPLLWGGQALRTVVRSRGTAYTMIAASAWARASEMGIPPRGADDVGMATGEAYLIDTS